MKSKHLGECEICDKQVSELGAYVKLSINKYAHASCYAQEWQEKGIEIGRQAVLQEQAEVARKIKEREERELLERQAKERAERERAAEVAERERTNRILAAQKIPMPEKVKPEEKKDAEKDPSKDRFTLIDLD